MNPASAFSYNCTTTIHYTQDWNGICGCWGPLVYQSHETNCTYTYYDLPSIDADPSEGGGGSVTGDGWGVWTGGGSGGGSSSGTGNNGNTGTTIATSPFTQSQIDKLTIQTKNSQIKARIQQMENDLNTATKEQGSEFIRIPNNSIVGSNTYFEYQIPDSQTTFSGTLFPSASANSVVRVHMHHNNSQINENGEEEKLSPIFSIEDVFGMSEFYKQKRQANSGALISSRDENISSILVSRRGLYAVRVNDADKVLEFNEHISSDATNSKNQTYKEWIIEGFAKKVIEKTIRQCGNCNDAQEEALFELNFINFFKQLDIGLSLFVSYETDDNGDYIWTFLTN